MEGKIIDQLKLITDFILKIREQDTVVYGTLFTVLVGAVLAGILAAAIVSASGTKKITKRQIARIVLSVSALLFFMWFTFAAHDRQVNRKDFGIKWIEHHISSTEKPVELMKKYCRDYYTLKEVDAWFVFRFRICPVLAAASLLGSLFLRPPKSENKK